MDLFVDIGNSRIKWSDPDDLREGRVASGSCDELSRLLKERWRNLEKPTMVWVSSVVSEEMESTLNFWIKDVWNLSPYYVMSNSCLLGVTNGYKNPSQLGVDRWMALIGARALTQQAIIIGDCGTATTIDAMDPEGRHLGGVILPGLQMMQRSLLGNTAIPQYGESAKQSIFAKDTASGIKSAVVMATSCLIERMAKSLQKQVNGKVICVLTGGAAEKLDGSLDLDVQHEPNLVLKGLALVAKQVTDQ